MPYTAADQEVRKLSRRAGVYVSAAYRAAPEDVWQNLLKVPAFTEAQGKLRYLNHHGWMTPFSMDEYNALRMVLKGLMTEDQWNAAVAEADEELASLSELGEFDATA